MAIIEDGLTVAEAEDLGLLDDPSTGAELLTGVGSDDGEEE